MTKICKLCGKEFEPRVYNATICYEPHNIPCRICGKLVNIDGHDNRAKQRMFLERGFVYCSHDCSCIGTGQDKWDKENEKVDLDRLKYLRTQTSMFDTDIAKELNTSIDFVRSRCDKFGWDRPEELQQELQYNKNKLVSDSLTDKYKDEEAKQQMLDKASATYKERTGYNHNFKNPEEREKYNKIKVEKYGNLVNSTKRKKTNLAKYGVESMLDKEEVRQKGHKAVQEKFGFVNSTRRNINKEIQILMDSKDEFIKYLNSIPYKERTLMNITKNTSLSYTTVHNLVEKYGCHDIINYSTSTFEIDVRKLLENYNIEYVTNDRKIIAPLELDIYIPKYRVAIECNGVYWHSSLNKNYHYNKSKLCEEKGIRLIHIWDYEWENERQRPILENIILNACNQNMNKIYARKCTIGIRKSSSMRDFFNKNNIQGFRGGKFAICLIYENEVVMSYMMGNAYFGKGKYEWEVVRGATKLGYTIIGGASRIFKYFIDNYEPNNCVYYIDYNYFNGSSLNNLPNMEYIKTQVSFKNYWVNEGIIKNREPLRHKEIKKLYKEGTVRQIWNAGTKVYIWKNQQKTLDIL